jgi:dTDP-4-amino-4,6-dideoxygalactose transaminase
VKSLESSIQRLHSKNTGMFKEIGSNFWIDPDNLKKNASIDLKLKYIDEKERIIYSSSGRGAISLILDNINQPENIVLIPVYTCKSVILPFITNNFKIYYYDINLDLSVNADSLEECIKKYQPKIIFFQSYFGFDTLFKMRTKYQSFRKDGIIIIEDITHSLFSNIDKSGADFYIASLRKWIALPDGGVAISTYHKIIADNSPVNETIVNQNIKAFKLTYEYTRNLDKKLKIEAKRLLHESEDLLDEDCKHHAISEMSKTMLSGTDIGKLTFARQSNYKYLSDHLKLNSWFEPVFNDLPDEIVPLFFPVYLKCDRAKFQKYLADKEIYAPIHWPIPENLKVFLTNYSSYIFHNILSIPCDQRYIHKDLERIIEAFYEYKD